MGTRLSDLNKHLFDQLERLADQSLTPDAFEIETRRASSLVAISEQIVKTNALSIKVAELVSEYGSDPAPYLIAIEEKRT